MCKDFLRNLKSLHNCDKFEEFLQKLYNFYITVLDLSFIFFSKVLIDNKTSNNRFQIVVKPSKKFAAKIFILL